MNFLKLSVAIFIVFVAFVTAAQRSLHYVFMGTDSYGHLKPTLELVESLTKLGHHVTYFNVPQFKNEIESVGATFVDYNISNKRSEPDSSENMDLSLEYLGLNDVMIELWPTLLEFKKLNNIDVIIYDQFAIWGKLLAHQYNIPSVCSSIMLLRTPEEWRKFSTKIPDNKNSFSFQEMLDYLSCLGADKVIAYTSAGFQPEFKNYKNIIFFGNRLNKETLLRYKTFDHKSLIYVSFGTTFNGNFGTLNKLIDFFKNTSYKIIISTGGNEEVYNKLLEKKAFKNIQIYKFVNQVDILSKASLFITHVGAGSLYEAISASVPMIMIPQMEEQYANAYKARKLKLGYLMDSKNISEQEIQKALNDINYNWQKYRDASLEIRKTFLNSSNAEAVSHSIEVK